jgi:hypothetical protein
MRNTLFILFLLFTKLVWSQINLIPNPSFEIIDTCSFSLGHLSIAKPWKDPALTADIYSSCSTIPDVNVPDNIWGNQYAHSGNNYSGIQVFSKIFNSGQRAYEYLQTHTLLPLQSHHIYYMEFFVSLSDSVCLVCNSIGSRITVDSISCEPLNQLYGQQQITNISPLNNKNSWVKISGKHLAIGGENYITIGNFLSPNESDTVKIQGCNTSSKYSLMSYYYIDDVSLYDVTIDAGRDTVICNNASHTLQVTGAFSKYTWSTGDTTHNLSINQSGTYWVKGNIPNIGDFYDSVTVLFTTAPIYTLCTDTNIYEGTQATLVASGNYQHYVWSNNQSTPNITVSDSGVYTVKVYDYEECSTTKSATVHVIEKPQLPFIAPTVIDQSNEKLVFTPLQNWRYELSIKKLTVYDALGRLLHAAEPYKHDFPQISLPIGIYYYQVEFNHQVYSSKLLIR